ncbi:MAG: hypothetical protein AAFQ82_23015, partial [Myxococcota bacterium]
MTEDSSDFRTRMPLELVYDDEDAGFICRNALGVAPLPGEPFKEGETYAVVVTRGVSDLRGDGALQDLDFTAMLAAEAPQDELRPELEAAYAAMTPLRSWLAVEGLDSTTIAVAAVFTTDEASTSGSSLRAAARTLPQQTRSDAVLCPGSAPSPCAIPGAPERGCPDTLSTSFLEVQGTYTGPVFQTGERPYDREGGQIVRNAAGEPQLQAVNETMCFGLALPPATLTGGVEELPVVIYAHGTGGNYRSAFEDGTAEMLTAEGFAVLTFDNVMHGPRQGGAPESWTDPGQLFFNPLNPRASRDNVLQGAGDLFRLVHLAEGVTITVNDTDVSFDPSNIYFYGHSQGTVISPAFLAFEANLAGAFQSGAGAELALSILNKSEPQVIDQAVAASFGERRLERLHPMLGLLAQLFAPADALAYAPRMVQSRPGGPLLYLQVQGIDDRFTPDVTQHALIKSMGIPFVGPV